MHKSTANRFDTRPERQSHLYEYTHTHRVYMAQYLRLRL